MDGLTLSEKNDPKKAIIYDNIQQKITELKTLHEIQADIFLSIDNHAISTSSRSFRKDYFYTNQLYIQHYDLECAINECHKMIHHIQIQE